MAGDEWMVTRMDETVVVMFVMEIDVVSLVFAGV